MSDQRKVRARKALLAQAARAKRARNPKKYAAKARVVKVKPRGYVKPGAKSTKAYYAAKKQKSKLIPAWRTLGHMKLYSFAKKKPCNCGRKIK